MHAFPWAEEIKIAEFLNQRHRFIDHTALRIVVANLDMPGQREILAKRMPFEPVIGQQTPKVRMAGEEDTEHVPGFALRPVGRGIDSRHRRHRLTFANGDENAHPHVVLHRQKLIDHLETFRALRIIDGGQVRKLVEAGVSVVAKRRQRFGHCRNRHFNDNLILGQATGKQRLTQQLPQMVEHALLRRCGAGAFGFSVNGVSHSSLPSAAERRRSRSDHSKDRSAGAMTCLQAGRRARHRNATPPEMCNQPRAIVAVRLIFF